MKTSRIIAIAMMSAICMVSCVDEFEISVEGVSDYIVIDAVVTDCDTVQRVFIRRDRDIIIDPYQNQGTDTIKNVTVRIADDLGWNAVYSDVSNGLGRKFELKGHQFETGRTYTMTVSVGDRLFEATETMPPLPIIDRLDFYSRPSKDNDGLLWSPILYFRDNQPEVDNYYLFVHQLRYIREWAGFRYLFIQALTDVGLKGDMEGVKISLGFGEGSENIEGTELGDPYHYEFYSISKRNYDYFEVIKDQLTSDGGVYQPSPTTPTTNFSGKFVQGQFMAASMYKFSGRILY